MCNKNFLKVLILIISFFFVLCYPLEAELIWPIETVDSVGDVGLYNSLAMESADKAHISYYDATNKDLKYATNENGTWVTETVYSEGNVGLSSSLALDAKGKVHISYCESISNGDDLLKYASNTSGTWVTETVHSKENVGSITLILDSEGKAHISFRDYIFNTSYSILYSTNKSGTWVSEVVASEATDAGSFLVSPSLALDADGNAHISYGFRLHTFLSAIKYATNSSGVWVTESVFGYGSDPESFYTSLDLDAEGKVHISYCSYYYYDTGALRYATNRSGVWIGETVDSEGGKYPSLALDSYGKAHISYYDTINGDLKYASNVSGAWVMETLDIDGDVGGYTSLALDSNGNAHISYYDYTNKHLKYIHKCPEMDIDCDEFITEEDNCSGIYNPNQEDKDSDGVGDVCDNCPNQANPGQEDTGDGDGAGDSCDNCLSISNHDQLDSYPPGGNGIGDACDCEGDFNCDADVDGSDASTFKADFGRSPALDPCVNESPCNGDFSCDGDVDGTDASLFKQDFGRSSMQNPCPVCVAGAWCGY